MLKLAESLPNTASNQSYCSDNFRSLPILHRLACIAHNNRMFVSADMLDIQPFQASAHRTQSRDNVLIYNTQVLFDREGRLLAKYHKMNPFSEPEKDKDYEQRAVVVETEIGRLGLNICFDLLFASPSHESAKRGQVDTVLSPNWWLDQLPLLQAAQVQAAFATGHGVNLIATNIHNVTVSLLLSYLKLRTNFIFREAPGAQESTPVRLLNTQSFPTTTLRPNCLLPTFRSTPEVVSVRWIPRRSLSNRKLNLHRQRHTSSGTWIRQRSASGSWI